MRPAPPIAPVRRLACAGRGAATRAGAAGSIACGVRRTAGSRFAEVRTAGSIALVAWGLSLAAPVLAAPAAGLRLEWVAPPACPQAAQVREMAAAVLGRPLDPGATPTTSVQARVTATARGFALTIETRSAGGTDVRRMQDARCSVLAEATAVIAATAVDPSLTPPPLRADPPADLSPETGAGLVPAPPVLPGTGAELPPGTGAPGLSPGTGGVSPGTGTPGLSPGTGDVSPGTGTPGLSPGTGGVSPGTADMSPGTGVPGLSPGTDDGSPRPGTAAQPERTGPGARDLSGPGAADLSDGPGRSGPRGARLRGALRLAGVADLGSGPLGTGGLVVTGALLGPRWRAELSGLWLAPRTIRPDAAVDLEARISLIAAALRGCLTPRLSRTDRRDFLELLACGGLEAGAVRGRGAGAELGDAAAADVLPWVAVSVGPGLAYAPVPRLALTLQVDLVVPLLRPRFAVREGDGYRDLYRGGVAAGRVALGLEVRFR